MSKNYSKNVGLSGSADAPHAINISLLINLIYNQMQEAREKYQDWFVAPEILIKKTATNNNTIIPDIGIFKKDTYIKSKQIDIKFFVEVTKNVSLPKTIKKAEMIFKQHSLVTEGFIFVYDVKIPYFTRFYWNRDKSEVKSEKSSQSAFLRLDLSQIMQIYKAEFNVKK